MLYQVHMAANGLKLLNVRVLDLLMDFLLAKYLQLHYQSLHCDNALHFDLLDFYNGM